MPRPKLFIQDNYGLEQNPFPHTAIAQWGSSDERENGALYNADVVPKEYAEAIAKFVVGPIDSGSKFHFLWSLGEGEEARGFGKTVLLGHIAREIDSDLGRHVLLANEFDEQEASDTPVLAAMGTFNKNDVTGLAAVSLEQVRYLAQSDPATGKSPLAVLRDHLLRRVEEDLPKGKGAKDRGEVEAEAIRDLTREASLSLGGKTLGSPDRRLLDHFANADWRSLVAGLRDANAKNGFELLSSCLIIARAAGVKRALLFIDQVEDFATADTPKKRRSLEIERFRDIAVETQPFGEMASYVLTMHPAAARSIEEYWSLARLPKMDHLLKQNERITLILRPLKRLEDAEKLLVGYLGRFRRQGSGFDALHPFDRAAVAVVLDVCGGRPGLMLKLGHDLIEEGARSAWPRIGEREARMIAEDRHVEAEAQRTTRRRRVGAVE
jgi:hypothetical protein